jgi:hypothetical protein
VLVRIFYVGQQVTANGIGVTKAGADKVTNSLFIESVVLAMNVEPCAKIHNFHFGSPIFRALMKIVPGDFHELSSPMRSSIESYPRG